MAKFVLTAQLNLQAPKNISQIANQIQQQLSGATVNIGVQGASQAVKQVNQVTAATNNLASSASKMGDAFGVSLKRFTAFSIASRAVGLFTSKLAGAVDEAISFQNEIVRLSQVTGESISSFGKLTSQITKLSTTLGVSSKELLSVATILAQAGLNARDTEIAVNALAKTALAPTFGDITDTAEGAVAVIAQFGEGVGALERQLGAINEVSAKFAVESEDLISVIRRTGGVFKASGGSLEDLLALFTSVRATTRESAESIATGLRTIFTRLQRPQTIEYLKQFGVELTDLNGKFIGPYEAIRQLSEALSGLEEGDVRFIQIAEELGGYRQIGKVIPLLRQFEIAEKARQAAIEGGTSLDKDAIVAQQSLAVQFTKVREQFLSLIRGISETSSFQVLVKTSLNLASALIQIADALKPLIPLLATFAAVKLTTNIGGFLRGFGAGFGKVVGPNPGTRRQFGGPIGFASGGLVPGTGNGDTVPAMLTPGEFVIRKSSVGKIGADNLAAMNASKYAFGGVVKVKNPDQYGALVLDQGSGKSIAQSSTKLSKAGSKAINILEGRRSFSPIAPVKADRFKEITGITRGKDPKQITKLLKNTTKKEAFESAFKNDYGRDPKGNELKQYAGSEKTVKTKGEENFYEMVGPFPVFGVGSPESIQTDIQKEFSKAAKESVIAASQSILNSKIIQEQLKIGPLSFKDGVNFRIDDLMQGAQETIEGYLLEAVLGSIGDAKIGGGQANFDFPNINSQVVEKLKNLFNPNDNLNLLKKADAKRKRVTATKGDGALVNKIAKDLQSKSDYKLLSSPKVVKKALGGNIAASDTVPALLTPGEFVVNKKAASNIGYANLNRMNKKGVTGFAKGGPVGVQRFSTGGGAKAKTGNDFGGLFNNLGFQIVTATSILQSFNTTADGSTTAFSRVIDTLVSFSSTIGVVIGALQAFGISLNAKSIFELFGTGPNSIGGKISSFLKKPGEGFRESFSLARTGQKANQQYEQAKSTLTPRNKRNTPELTDYRQRRAQTIRDNELRKESGYTTLNLEVDSKRKARADQLRNLRRQRNLPQTKSLTGKAGQFLGKVAGGGGRFAGVAKAGAGLLARGGVAAAGVGLGGAAAGAAALLGPVGAVVTGLTALSSVLNAAFGYQEAYNQAVQEGNVTKAQELAVLKEVPGLVQGFDYFVSGSADAYQNIVAAFGGDSVEKLKQRAVVDASIVALEKDRVKLEKTATEALKDFEAGTISAAEASKATSEIVTRNAQIAQDRRKLAAATEAEKSTGFSAYARNIFTIGGLLGETAAQRNSRLDTEASGQRAEAQKIDEENFRILRENLSSLSGRFAAANGSFDQFVAGLDKGTQDYIKYLSDSASDQTLPKEQREASRQNLELLKKDYENQRKAIQENIKFIQALNFGLRDVNARAAATSLAMSNLSESLETGYNQFSVSLSTLEASLTSTAAAIDSKDMDSAVTNLENSLRGFGADEQQVKTASGTVKGFQTAQKELGGALEDTKNALLKGTLDLKGSTIKDTLVNSLSSRLTNVSPEIKARILDSLGELEIGPELETEIRAGNFGGVIEKALGPLGDAINKDVLGPLKERQRQEDILINLTKQRIDLEKGAIESRKQALDIEIEARKAIEEFGGPVVTSTQKLNNLNKQLGLDLNFAGVGGVGAGTFNDLIAAQNAVMSSFQRQEFAQASSVATTGVGAFGGAAGVSQDRRQQLEQAQQSIVDYSRKRLDLIREEISIAEKKNALEKSAFEKLVSGDIEGYIQDQQAAAASAALQIGDASLARLFGPAAVGAGLKNLQEQGVTGRRLEEAALAAGGTQRQAQIFASTTPEVEALKKQGREFANVLNVAGEGLADMQEMKVSAQNVVIQAASLKMGNAFNQQASMSNITQNRSRGGIIYASRGIFVPKGTDTVPAMLTPGEFVVNRNAVRSGNNLQILKAMNNGAATSNSSNGQGVTMSRGGQVGYYMFGGIVEALGNTLGNLGNVLSPIFDRFSESIKQLQNIQLSVKLDTTNVNVNFNGAGFLTTLTEDVQRAVLTKVKQEIVNKLEIQPNGKASFTEGIK